MSPIRTQVWDWEFAWEILPEIAGGPFLVTLQATVMGTAIAMTLGLLLAIGRRSHRAIVHYPSSSFIEFIRRTPLLVQLFFLFFGLPAIGVTLPSLVAGVIGLGLHYSTYTSEVYRAGIEGVPRGQWEASRALNLSHRRTWTRVIIPQAVPKVIPALGNYFIAMFKETPLLSAILVFEMMAQATTIANRSFRALEAYTIVGVLFLVVSYLASLGVRRLERYLRNRTETTAEGAT